MKRTISGKSSYPGWFPLYWRWAAVVSLVLFGAGAVLAFHLDHESGLNCTSRMRVAKPYQSIVYNNRPAGSVLPDISVCPLVSPNQFDLPGDARYHSCENGWFAGPRVEDTRLMALHRSAFPMDLSFSPALWACLSMPSSPTSHFFGHLFSEDVSGSKKDTKRPSVSSPTGPRMMVATPRERVYQPIIVRAATLHQVDPALVMAVIFAESGYNPKAVSKTGAKGLMQLMPTTAQAMGVGNCFDPERNIDGGVKYLKKLVNKYGGNVLLALAAYNAGSRKVWEYRGVPPYKSTRRYIRKVLKYYRRYQGFLARGVERI